MNQPNKYLSYSEGRYRVIYQGLPVSNDKATSREALRAAASVYVLVDQAEPVWNGDRGEWVGADTFV